MFEDFVNLLTLEKVNCFAGATTCSCQLNEFFFQLNYQRDQVTAIKEKQAGKEDKEDSDLPLEKPFSAAVTDTSLGRSMITGTATNSS